MAVDSIVIEENLEDNGLAMLAFGVIDISNLYVAHTTIILSP